MAHVADHDRSRDRNHAHDRDPVVDDQDRTLVIKIHDQKVDRRVDQEVDLEADRGVTSLNFSPITVLIRDPWS